MPQEGVSCGPSLRKKLIDAARRLSKSALSLQVRVGRRDPIALGIENRDPITVVAFVVKCMLVSVIAMSASGTKWTSQLHGRMFALPSKAGSRSRRLHDGQHFRRTSGA